MFVEILGLVVVERVAARDDLASDRGHGVVVAEDGDLQLRAPVAARSSTALRPKRNACSSAPRSRDASSTFSIPIDEPRAAGLANSG